MRRKMAAWGGRWQTQRVQGIQGRELTAQVQRPPREEEALAKMLIDQATAEGESAVVGCMGMHREKGKRSPKRGGRERSFVAELFVLSQGSSQACPISTCLLGQTQRRTGQSRRCDVRRRQHAATADGRSDGDGIGIHASASAAPSNGRGRRTLTLARVRKAPATRCRTVPVSTVRRSNQSSIRPVG